MVRQRHPATSLTRLTHTTSPVDYTHPSDALYGSEVDVEPVTGIDIGAGSINDGHIVPGGLDGGTVIRDGTLPATSYDQEPPPSPSIFNARSDYLQQDDGSYGVVIMCELGYSPPPTGLEDLSSYIVVSTRYSVAGKPDWTLASQWQVVAVDPVTGAADPTGEFLTPFVQPSVLPGAHYWLQAYAVDLSGNRQQVASVVAEVWTDADKDGPPPPGGFILHSSTGSFSLHWNPVLAYDYDYAEVRWTKVPSGTPAFARSAGTVMVVTGLDNGSTYDVHVRTVDTSGNTVDADGLSYSVADSANDQKGWVLAGQAKPLPIDGDDLNWQDPILANVFAGKLSADWIVAGSLSVGAGSGMASAINVFDAAGEPLGTWDANGITLVDPNDKNYKMVLDDKGLVIWAGLNTTDPYKSVELNPLGISAASITFGAARGGHNLVRNSSFELGQFKDSVVVDHIWTAKSDWDGGRQGTDTNVSVGAGALSIGSAV